MIAYIASTGERIPTNEPKPTEPPPHGPYQPADQIPAITTYAVGVIEPDGANAQMYLLDDREKFNLSWA